MISNTIVQVPVRLLALGCLVSEIFIAYLRGPLHHVVMRLAIMLHKTKLWSRFYFLDFLEEYFVFPHLFLVHFRTVVFESLEGSVPVDRIWRSFREKLRCGSTAANAVAIKHSSNMAVLVRSIAI